MDQPLPRLLIIDDSSLDLRQWSRMFAELGYEVHFSHANEDFKSREDLRAIVAQLKPDFVLTDYDMQGFNAFIVLSTVQEAAPGVPVALHSSRLDEIERFSGKSRQQLSAPGLFLIVAEKGSIKEIDMAFKNHLQSAHRSTV